MKKKLIIIISAVIVVAYFSRVIYVNVNDEFKDIECLVYDMGETCQIDDFTYTVKAFDIYTMYEMEEKFNIDLDDEKDCNKLYNVVTLDVKNISEDSKICPMVYGEFVMTSGAWRNGTYASSKINDVSKLTPGENRTMYVYATNEKVKIGYSNRKEISREMEFNLVRIYYPKEVRLKCY
ncbi:MAG: hypothetical protein IKL73_06180 [Lachnospiraceae bacterium]|nr:hypothetical protein [Lachnospiraceae bacterium]